MWWYSRYGCVFISRGSSLFHMWMSSIFKMFSCKHSCYSYQQVYCSELCKNCWRTLTFYGNNFREREHLCMSKKKYIIEKILPISKCFLTIKIPGGCTASEGEYKRPENLQSLIFYFQKEACVVSALYKIFFQDENEIAVLQFGSASH